MNRTLIFASREYKASVRTKGFLIGLILAPIFMGGSLITFALMKDRVDTADKTVAILDRSGVMGPVLVEAAETRNQTEVLDPDTGKKTKPAYLFELISSGEPDLDATRFELSSRIRAGKLHAFVEIGPEVVHPGKNRALCRIAYHAKNGVMDDLRRWMGQPINNHLRKLRLADAGIEEAQVKDLFRWVNVDSLGLVSKDVATGQIQKAERTNEIQAILIPIIAMMLMFLMVMMSVPGMLQSVMEEKTQRIAEVLMGSIRPFEFMMGKLLSGIAVALTSSAVYIIGMILVVRHMGFQSYIPYHILPWFFAYMLLAILMLGALSAAMGSTCSEAKDAQALTFPTMIPAMIPMFVYFPIVKEPASGFATTMSLIPPFTPFLMLLRQATPEGVPTWQPIVGLAGVVLCTLLFVWLGGRIFRVAILMQGTPPKLTNIVRWAFRG
ncbi:MAG: ABC transporter permease [Planctomycetes bacterium]|nr:ABC transporter permease [Planctomycetota bacterium]